MKRAILRSSRSQWNRQSGQTITLVLLCMGLFLLAAIGVSVDVSNWWFHRQMAQGAADAACTAGVMDLLANTQGQSVGAFPGGSPPASYACSSATGSAACQYAALNGYNGAGRVANTASNDVMVSFPGSVPGLSACGPSNPPPCVPTGVANPFIQVTVVDRVPTSFTGLLSGSRTTDVAGSAVCGIINATSPVPIIVLHPTCSHPFEVSGSATVRIVGGPTRSIQVNSNNATCAAATNQSANQCSGNGTIDLSKGGPSFTGSDFGVFGAPKTPPTNFTGANWTTGSPISDPFMLVNEPAVPALSLTNGGGIVVDQNVDGCPDDKKCKKYLPGLYTNPIVVKGETAIFVPGIYYMRGTASDNASAPGSGCVAGPTGQGRYVLDVDANGVVRPASNTAVGSDGSNGVMFYMSGSGGAGTYGSVFFGSNAGKPAGGHTITPYTTANATCPGGTAPPAQLGLPATVDGNVLLGQCTSKGTYIGGGSTDTAGTIRGLIFFQDRRNGDAKGQPSMQGGGGLVISGNMYFHNCNAAGTGVNCSAPAAGYNAFLQLQGNPGGSAYVLGNITTDELVIAGNGGISMALNPNAVYNIYKASLLQ